jgi:O-antigen ligase
LWRGRVHDQTLWTGVGLAGFLIALALAVTPSAQYVATRRRAARRRAATLADVTSTADRDGAED